ncbi:MAG TPA: allophanate hydrolase, partial [Methylomirabilota bacterium]
MSLVLVEDAGPLTTVQDLGRPGHLRVGIPASGPMDREAFLLANRLIGNADNAAGLECTLIGPRLAFTDERLIAITGADMAPL